MKILTVKNALKAAAILPLLTSASFALSLSDPSVVGTVKDASPASPTADQKYVENLLGLGPNTTQSITDPNPIGTHTYQTFGTDYNATIGAPTGSGSTTAVGAGFDFIIAKYGNGNNDNGGALVLYLGGAAYTLPSSEAEIFGDTLPHGLSGWRGFDGDSIVIIPPEGTLPDGGATMALLGGGISALALLRRKLS